MALVIEVLGPGCKNCDTLYDNVAAALEATGLAGEARLEKKKEIDYFLKKGVFSTPGLIINDQVVASGRVLSQEQIIEILKSKHLA